MSRRPDFALLQRALRVYVCSKCPRHTPGTSGFGCATARPCERDCPLFVHLPLLKQTVEQLDPMLCSPQRVLHETIDALIDSSIPGNPLTDYREQVVGMISKLIEP